MQPAQRLLRQVVLASCAALYLVLILTVTAFASDVSISDQAGVLNQSQVHKAASELGYPVSIYTVNDFNGSTQQFDQRASNITANHSNTIVTAIDTNRRHVFVTSGRDVPLTHSDNTNAVQSFISSFKGSGGNYTDATVSALNSLKSSLATGGGGNNNRGGIGIGTCLLGLLIIGGLIFFLIRKSRRTGARSDRPGILGSLFNRRRSMNADMPPPYQGNPPPYQGSVPPYQGDVPPYQGNFPPYQGNVPPYYGSGYPPQQRGMNPLAAGGLGAAAGGLLGYELGRNQANRDTGSESGGNFGSSEGTGSGAGGSFGEGDTGNESGGDFGGGSGGFFGGDDTSNVSGGDFGSSGNSDGGSGGNF